MTADRNSCFFLYPGNIVRRIAIFGLLRFLNGIKKLSENDIYTYVSPGNHDPYPVWDYVLKLADDDVLLKIFPSDNVECIDIVNQSEIIAKIYGIGFSKIKVTENLSKKFPIHNDTTIPAIGMLHCNIGKISEQENYSPCTINDLVSLGYNYWALGHIHVNKEIKKENPSIIYSGNPQGKSSKEIGPKSCLYVTIETNENCSWEYLDTDIIQWVNLDIDISNLETETELINSIEDMIEDYSQKIPNKSIIFSINLKGFGILHRELIDDTVLDAIIEPFQKISFIPPFTYIGQIINNTTTPIKREDYRNKSDLRGEIVSITDDLLSEPEHKTMDEILKPLFQNKIIKNFNLDSMSEEEKNSLILRAESLLLEKIRGSHED